MLNAIARIGYRCLYRAALVWWFLRRPRTASAVVALWHDGRLLLVQTSYRPQYGLPGGFLKTNEAPAQGAARELFEELDLDVPPSTLRAAWRCVKRFEYREETISFFEFDLDRAVSLHANQRELVWAGWKTPAEALAMPLLPHVRDYLLARAGGAP